MAPRLLASVSTILVLGLQGAAIAADVAEPTQPVEAPIVEVEPNWYIAARLGAAFPLDTDWSLLGGAVNVSNEYDTGWVGGLAVGTQFDVGGFRPRAEIEVGYMRSDIDRHVIDGVPIAGPDAVGHTGVLYGLVNGYLDFGPGPLKPYVGAGLGIGHAEFQDQGVDSLGGTFMDDSGTGFAWQIGGGLSYSFNAQATVELGYRYFNVEDVGLTAIDGTESSTDVRAHQVMGGFRYAF
ncbi:MAG: outer membrane beta-barrel protein [Mesorhizobium sp.]